MLEESFNDAEFTQLGKVDDLLRWNGQWSGPVGALFNNLPDLEEITLQYSGAPDIVAKRHVVRRVGRPDVDFKVGDVVKVTNKRGTVYAVAVEELSDYGVHGPYLTGSAVSSTKGLFPWRSAEQYVFEKLEK